MRAAHRPAGIPRHKRKRTDRGDSDSAAARNRKADADARRDRKRTRQTLHALDAHELSILDPELSIRGVR